ncbi:hypothetical protein J7337_006497 [Fusarium musae]|uniref:Heterokaryon incompatibility protein n=1 Tax=Fusarium musae TaxID=1042133 RepID=A0A9P8DF92_9HYPO|nr:hypothetical protein J7337_006497 [Fusarium musae]KAG9500816.1 hypothetical protein J7337_006497 [Fusarium musae]
MARFVFRGIINGNEDPAFLSLYFSPDSKASNKLDYIYGLLAVTKSPITPDYTKSIREVTLEFMAYATGLKRLDDLPSWAPVFSEADRRKPIARGLKVHRPAYDTVPELSNGLPIDIDGDSLWIKGVKVQVVGTVYEKTVSANLLTTGLQQCIMEFTQSPQDIYPTGKSVLEIIYCTLLQIEPYDNYAVDLGLCLDRLTHPETPVLDRNWTMQWTQKSSVGAVLAKWYTYGRHHPGNRLFKTNDGYIGTMADDVQRGDVVCVLAGSEELAVLRPEEDHYLFVGCCFMIGLMSGEVSELLKLGKVKIEKIEIR